MSKFRFWEIVVYVSLSVIVIWTILKITGVINTPIWLQYGLPLLSAVFALFGVYKDFLDRINNVAVSLVKLEGKTATKEDIKLLESDIHTLKTDMQIIKKHINLH